MTVTIGTRVGSYEVRAQLGQGGMGEVFQARDTKLGRDVAIKVISSTFTHDAERVARFEREAQLLASLNHPHIAGVYGLEELAGIHFLVMELVEGETLASRLIGGPLPVTDAIRLAGQIADALQAAHDKGIIHRDLKPANIALAADGQVKVLDFGLAKAIAPDESAAHSAANSPTLTVAATQAGVILGTAAYMSPEQAKGKAADKRSDIWAFGAVVYEMLTGRPAFGGEDVADVLAAVLTREPDWSALPPGTPPGLVALLHGCLQRERQLRIADIAVVRYVLADRLDAGQQKSTSSRGPGFWRIAAIASTIVAAVLAGTSGYLARRAPAAAPPSWSSGPIRLTITPPPGTTFYNGDYGVPFAVSPDGRQIAFVATSATGVRHVWIRALEATAARMLPETAGASSPFWSPDNSWIGFLANDQMQRVRASGGTPQVLAPWTSRLRVGATWSRDDVLLFQAASLAGLSRLPAQGGTTTVVTKVDRPEDFHSWPQFLQDGRRFVYLVPNAREVRAGSLDGGLAQTVLTTKNTSTLGYAPGFLLYVERGALYASRFDEVRLQLSGERARIIEGIPVSGPGRAPFSISANGVLAYSSQAVGDVAVLQWFNRQGQPEAIAAPAANYTGFTFTPDGRRVAFARWDAAGGRDVWVRDLTTGAESRLTADGDSMMPVWSPRGGRVVYASGAASPPDLHLIDLEGSARPELLVAGGEIDEPESWTPDGSAFVFTRQTDVGLDLWQFTVDGRRAQALPINTSFNEWQARVSPDGRWIAYVSDETGANAVFVAAFPSGRGKRAVSAGGGTAPQWRADGRELFYVSDTAGMMSVPVTATDTALDIGRPVELFRLARPVDVEGRNDAILYRAEPSGQRFLIATKAPAADSPPIYVVLNWPALIP